MTKLFERFLLIFLITFCARITAGPVKKAATLPTDPPLIQLLMARAGIHFQPGAGNNHDSVGLKRNAYGDIEIAQYYTSDSLGILYCTQKDSFAYGQDHRIDSTVTYINSSGTFVKYSGIKNTYTSQNKLFVSVAAYFFPAYTASIDSFFYTPENKPFLHLLYSMNTGTPVCQRRTFTHYDFSGSSDTVYNDYNCDGQYEQCVVYTTENATDSLRSFREYEINGATYSPVRERSVVFVPGQSLPTHDSTFIYTGGQRICIGLKNTVYLNNGKPEVITVYAASPTQFYLSFIDSFRYDNAGVLILHTRWQYSAQGEILSCTRHEFLNNSLHVPVTENVFETNSSLTFILTHVYRNYYNEYLFNGLPRIKKELRLLQNPSAGIKLAQGNRNLMYRVFAANGRICFYGDADDLFRESLALPAGFYILESSDTSTGERSTVKWLKISE